MLYTIRGNSDGHGSNSATQAFMIRVSGHR